MNFNGRTSHYFPRYSYLMFILVLFTMFVLYDYEQIMFKPAQSLHLWRQSDCLSITLNYAQDNRPFLAPAIHNLGEDGSGQTISEFPLIYYTIGQVWKLTGPKTWIYRLIVCLFFFVSQFLLFRYFENEFKDSYLAIIIGAFLFTSPTLVYYANNFLMDIPAFSLACIGLISFLKYLKYRQERYFYLMAGAYCLAGLLKITSLISFMAIVLLFGLEKFGLRFQTGEGLLKKSSKKWMILLLVLFIQLLWYQYAIRYNHRHNSGVFLTGLLPVWELDYTEISNTWRGIKEHLRWDYFRPVTSWILGAAFVFCLVNFRILSRRVTWLLLFTFAGMVVFVLGFYQALADHDYYTINLFIFIPILWLVFVDLLRKINPKIIHSWIFRIILLVLLIHNIDFARRRIEDRYNPGGWQNSYYADNISLLEKIQPVLDSLGIDQSRKIVVPSDNSINISLYKMNRKGWTNYGRQEISKLVDQGAEFLIRWEDSNQDWKQETTFEKIGQFQQLEIYRLN